MSADFSTAASNALHSVGECLSSTISSGWDLLSEGWEILSKSVQETVLPFFKSMIDVVMNHQQESLFAVGGLVAGSALTYVVNRYFSVPTPNPDLTA